MAEWIQTVIHLINSQQLSAQKTQHIIYPSIFIFEEFDLVNLAYRIDCLFHEYLGLTF